MLEQAATVLVGALYFYGVIGIVFAIPFVVKGVQRIDEEAIGSGWGFRLLILPGCMAFWPFLLRRWVSGRRTPPEERSPHR
ncbi:MAG TPA: hypothetical protein VN620_11400 [Candidatus Methylomirabilis sp.]|nr:hypothetical protein [Candidatus Methylomirabilis sp.]